MPKGKDKKVFCCDCGYVVSFSNYGRYTYSCLHEDNIKHITVSDSFYEPGFVHSTMVDGGCKKYNKHNNCQRFEPKNQEG
jgi:hypothetical protein